MALQRKDPQRRIISMAGEYPVDLPRLSPETAQRVPGLLEWFERLERWHFEFKTVLRRKEDELQQVIDSHVGPLETFANTAKGQLTVLLSQVVDLQTELGTITDAVNLLVGLPNDVREIQTSLREIIIRIERLETSDTIQARDIRNLQTRVEILELGDSYEHTQNSPVSTWVVSHNLGRRPNVSIVNSVGDRVHGKVVYSDANKLEIRFNSNLAGYAECS